MRLIDADALHKAYMELRNFKQDPQSGDWISLKAVPLTTVIRMLNDAPTIEPKRGEWKRRIVDNGFNADWVCSECGYRVKTDFVDYNFCPNCGADMREREGRVMAELKPCPFCGRIPNTYGCKIHGYFVVCDCGIEQSRIYKQKCDAVKHWNRRKTEPTISKEEIISNAKLVGYQDGVKACNEEWLVRLGYKSQYDEPQGDILIPPHHTGFVQPIKQTERSE